MKFNKFAFVVAMVLSAILFAEVALHAEERDQSTSLTFSKPTETPGQFEPAGHEFVHPKQKKQQLAQYRQQTIAVQKTAEAGD